MATSSIFHNIVIDSPEKAEKLVEALKKAYTQEICNIRRSCWNCAYFDEDTETVETGHYRGGCMCSCYLKE